MRWISRLTTFAIVTAVIVGLALAIRSKIPDASAGGRFLTSARFRDASRLQVGSPVVIAGVRVGDITGLTIEGRLARVDMRLRDDVKLPVDTFATRRADSLFGDSYIELVPIGDDRGTVYLRSGEPIRHVQEGGSTDQTLRDIARAMPKIDAALDRVHRVAIDGRRWVNGSVDETVRDVDRWLASGNLEQPLASADRAMASFERGTTAAADAIGEAAPDIERRLTDFDDAITRARTQIADAREGLTTALADARAGFDRVDTTLADLDEVVTAIDEGHGDDFKGSLGRMINDPGLANTLDDFSGDLAEGAAGLVRFRSWLGGRAEVSLRDGEVRTYAIAELYTRTDKFYLIEFSYSGLGDAPQSTLADAAGSPEFTRTQEIRDRFRLTAQFGKRIGFLRGRAGLKDSTPGIGVDALFFDGRLRLSSDLFGSFDRPPRLKVAGAFAVFRSIYILAGVDDVLNAPGELPIRTGNTPVPKVFETVKFGRDYFLGASLHFTDAELATILRFYGALIGGLALAR